MRAFIQDLLATSEIERAELRWQIAQTKLGASTCTQREARRKHDASQDLVSRVFAALCSPASGYRRAYQALTRCAPTTGAGQ